MQEPDKKTERLQEGAGLQNFKGGGGEQAAEDFKKRLRDNCMECQEKLKEKYQNIVLLLHSQGAYIWGMGRLGRFTEGQCRKNQVIVHGFLDNGAGQPNGQTQFCPCNVLKADDIVVIASFFYADIAQQLKMLGVRHFIYYEELALVDEGFASYYGLFEKMQEELVEAREEYLRIYDVFADDVSKTVYADIIYYRMSLDIRYTMDAFERSHRCGIQYLDPVVADRFHAGTVFYDVGGFDGASSLDFIRTGKGYHKVYFFEPDKEALEQAKKRLEGYPAVVFVQAGAGEANSVTQYDPLGNGAGTITDSGRESIRTVMLDDYIDSDQAYVKMDVEGYEAQVLFGMKQAILKYRPMLAVSVYHKSGDIHRLIDMVLSWNPSYKVYMRHYTKVYADTVCYFVDGEEI